MRVLWDTTQSSTSLPFSSFNFVLPLPLSLPLSFPPLKHPLQASHKTWINGVYFSLYTFIFLFSFPSPIQISESLHQFIFRPKSTYYCLFSGSDLNLTSQSPKLCWSQIWISHLFSLVISLRSESIFTKVCTSSFFFCGSFEYNLNLIFDLWFWFVFWSRN